MHPIPRERDVQRDASQRNRSAGNERERADRGDSEVMAECGNDLETISIRWPTGRGLDSGLRYNVQRKPVSMFLKIASS